MVPTTRRRRPRRARGGRGARKAAVCDAVELVHCCFLLVALIDRGAAPRREPSAAAEAMVCPTCILHGSATTAMQISPAGVVLVARSAGLRVTGVERGWG